MYYRTWYNVLISFQADSISKAMAFLDGKYEITSEHIIAEQQTQLDAIAPDGSALRIVCYDLKTAEEENHFERYRQILKRLKKQDLAAVHDIVSRPGTHYVAWHSTGKKRRAELNNSMKEMLDKYNFSKHQTDVRLSKVAKPLIYDLAFIASERPNTPAHQKQIESPEPLVEKPSKPTRLLPYNSLAWLLSAFLLMLSAGLFVLDLNLQANTKPVSVPDLLGQNINTASQELKRLNLKTTAVAVASDLEKGTIISVVPEPGTLLRPFYRTVKLEYALPEEQFALKAVPQLRGQTYGASTQVSLEQAGLRLGELVFIHSNNPRGLIIGQSVESSSQLKAASPVDILVSQGPESQKTFLPNLTGLSLEDALFLVDLAGFDPPTISRQPSLRYPEGSVISQSILPNVDVSLNSTSLRLTVAGAGSLATPQEVRTAPSLIGLSREEALRLASGYSLRFEEVDTANLAAGVIDQSPDPDAPLNGLEITLLINVYTPPVLIPVPRASAFVQPPQLRDVPFRFVIEQGIPATRAEVYALTAGGREVLILASQGVSGGDAVEGSYSTTAPGSITFILQLNGDEYNRYRVNP